MRRQLYILIIIFTSLFAVTSVFAQLSKEEKRARKKISRSLLKKVIASVDENKYQEAIVLIDSLLTLDPKNAEGYFYKGLVLAKTNDTTAALEALEEGITKVPLSSRLKIITSRLYINVGKPDEALAYLEAVLKIKPKNAESLYLSGIIYLQKADSTQALDLFEKALQNSLSGK